MQKIKKCVIPAAGMGTRFLPATKALPKEMFPIIDKPVMQLLVEEAISAGCSDIIIVTGRSKRAIEDHFDSNFELEERLDKWGKFDYLKTVKWLNEMANIVYVRQPYPKWDGDAILRTKNLIWDEPFLVLFWDDIIDNNPSAAQQLLEAFEKTNAPVFASVEVNKEDIWAYWIAETSEKNSSLFRAEKVIEKPRPDDTESRQAIIGKYILTPEIFEHLEDLQDKAEEWELRLADAFAKILNEQKFIYWVNIQWERFDTGSKIGYLKALVHSALQHEDLKEEFSQYLQSLSLPWKKS